MKVIYRDDLKETARQLRNNMTAAEVALWSRLRGKQLFGFDFDRQKPILNYIVDFYCFKLRLIIEIDGFSHDYKFDYDEKRQREIESQGFTVLRLQDKEVKINVDNVIEKIVDAIERLTNTSYRQ